jgi:hypothetical protein
MRCIACLLIALLLGCTASMPSPVEERSIGGTSENKGAPAAVSPPAPPAAPARPEDPIEACLEKGGTVTPAAGAGGAEHCEIPKSQ